MMFTARKFTVCFALCFGLMLAGFALAFMHVTPAIALEDGAYAAGQIAESQQGGDMQALDAQASVVSTMYVYNEGASFVQGTGSTYAYYLGNLFNNTYNDNWKTKITAKGSGKVVCKKVKGNSSQFTIKAKKAGTVTVTCKEIWTKTKEVWHEGTETQEPEEPGTEGENIEDDGTEGEAIEGEGTDEGGQSEGYYETVTVKKSKAHKFKIKVVSLKNKSGKQEKCVVNSGWYSSSKNFTYKIKDLPANADVQLVSDSNKNGRASLVKVAKGKVVLSVYGKGTHNVKLRAYGKTFTCKAILRELSLKKTSSTKNTGSVVAYPGQTNKVQVKVTGLKHPNVAWLSTNTGVATVDQSGNIRAEGVGYCYVKAKIGGAMVKVRVEVTSYDAYQAVQNAFADMRKNLSYSQPNRMSAESRDCSSYVSRCYWDDSLGRHIFLIGDGWASSWAYNAAAQASWLNDHGKRVSWSACSINKLRPGDTLYFETDYAGKDATQWRYIDHAAIYVGNGYYLNTHGSSAIGAIGYGYYSPGSSSVRFIGRPCP